MVRPNISVKIGKMKLKNPVMVASGTFGEEYGELIDITSLGAVVTKTITLKPRIGNPPPRLVETPSGMLNSIGLENKGLDFFIKNKLPIFGKFKTPLIVSIAGDDEDEFERLAKALSETKKISALELNLSCPNLIRGTGYGERVTGKETGIIAQDEKEVYRIVEKVRKATDLTVIAKLSPNVTDIGKMARSAEAAGADSISLVNTFLGMAIDIETKRPRLGNITGGLSGPAIRPLAVRMVWDVYNSVKIPIIGMGGIMDYRDALEFIIAGSAAVQVGTANFVEPSAPVRIIAGIKNHLSENKINDITKLIGHMERS